MNVTRRSESPALFLPRVRPVPGEPPLIDCCVARNAGSMTKYEQEEFVAKSALSIVGISFDSLQPGPDPPDLSLRIGDSQIALEVTSPPPVPIANRKYDRRTLEERWLSLQRELMKVVWASPQLAHYGGRIRFKAEDLPSVREEPEFIRELVSLAARMVQTRQSSTEDFVNYPTLTKYIDGFEVRRTTTDISWNWNFNSVFVDLFELAGRLSSAICRKARRRYDSSKYSEWRLVIGGGSPVVQPAGMLVQELLCSMDRLNAASAHSGFARIFLADLCFGEVAVWPGWHVFKTERGTTESTPTD